MLEFLQWMFGSLWIFLGMILLISIPLNFILYLFDIIFNESRKFRDEECDVKINIGGDVEDE